MLYNVFAQFVSWYIHWILKVFDNYPKNKTNKQKKCCLSYSIELKPAWASNPSEVIRWNENVHPRHVLGLKGALAVLGHVHIQADLLGSTQRLDQYQLAGLPVWTLHDEEASGVASHYTETQAVRPSASRWGSGRHAEKRGGGLEVGRQGQVVEGHGLRGQVAGAAVHGAGVPLTLTAGHTQRDI